MPSVRRKIAEWEASAAEALRAIEAMETAGEYDLEQLAQLRGVRQTYLTVIDEMTEWVAGNSKRAPKLPGS